MPRYAERSHKVLKKVTPRIVSLDRLWTVNEKKNTLKIRVGFTGLVATNISVAANSFNCSRGDTIMKFGWNILNRLSFHSSRLAT